MQDIELSEEQVMIRDMARDFARREIAPHAQAWEKACWITMRQKIACVEKRWKKLVLKLAK